MHRIAEPRALAGSVRCRVTVGDVVQLAVKVSALLKVIQLISRLGARAGATTVPSDLCRSGTPTSIDGFSEQHCTGMHHCQGTPRCCFRHYSALPVVLIVSARAVV